jgi:hypothetical protein
VVAPPGNGFGDGKTANGDIIRREVTVFSLIDHYRSGPAGNTRMAPQPLYQHCYWTIRNPDSQSSMRIEIAHEGKRLNNIGQVPWVDEALTKCQWWNGSCHDLNNPHCCSYHFWLGAIND